MAAGVVRRRWEEPAPVDVPAALRDAVGGPPVLAETLVRRGRPVRVFALDRLDERAMGALLMHFMLETVVAAELFGVDPFDQPAVEEGKRLTRQYLADLGAAGPG